MNRLKHILNNIFLEGLYLKDGELVYDFKTKKGLASNIGKGKGKVKFQPYEKKLGKYIIYSIYNKPTGIKDYGKILKTFKKDSSKEYYKFIKRSAIFISNEVFKNKKVDYILAPKSSSQVNNDILFELKRRMPWAEFIREAFKKVDADKIEIDYNNEKVKDNEKLVKILKVFLDKAKKKEVFSMHLIPPQYRVYFKNIFKIIDSIKLEKFENKNLVIFDDIVTSGHTLRKMMEAAEKYNPENIFAVTLFKE